jgi:hypothetical protein
MDQTIQRLLNDKLYDKRKQGALEYVRPEVPSYSDEPRRILTDDVLTG